MKKIISAFLIIMCSVILINAQATSAQDKEREERERRDRDFDRRVDALRNVDKVRSRVDPNDEFQIRQTKIKPLYRKPNAEELKLLAPGVRDLQTFSEFLSNKNTGIARLIIDMDCDKGSDVVVSTPHCLKYAMPGAGASYSFRVRNYQNKNLADLNFTGDLFTTPGVLKHGILVNIGDIPLESLTLDSKELNALIQFVPTYDFKKAATFSAMLEKGIDGGDVLYKNDASVRENTTYALRSIAYRGEVNQIIEGIAYNELEFDERSDILVVFRIVRLVPGESVTILWKELSNKKSPKMEIE